MRTLLAISVSLALLIGLPGCGESKVETAPVSNVPNYGENKMPPADKVVKRPGKGARSTGAPPQVR